jgi:hypothetical protein
MEAFARDRCRLALATSALTGLRPTVFDVRRPDSSSIAARARLRRPARRYDLHQHLTVLLVCAVATVVFTRGFLAVTGYPQVGGSKLHIAHVLWGGLLLLAALISTLASLSPATTSIAAVVGGVGFGLFIDEVGKFVTKDVNYFYRPAIAIIYVCFVGLFGVIRWLSRRHFSAEEVTLIGLETLQRAAVGALSEQRRVRVRSLMLSTDADSRLAQSVRELLEHATTEPERVPLTQRLSSWLAALWTVLTEHRLFRRGVFALLLVAAAISAAEAGWLLRDGIAHLSFSQRAFTLTTLVADIALLIGAVRLTRSLPSALHWYEHAVLLEITVAQIFLYTSEQLAATLNLIALLIIWSLLRWAIHFEDARHARRLLANQQPLTPSLPAST